MAVATLWLALMATSASAVTENEQLATFGHLGSEAGKLNIPRGLATDPITGHLYVADASNSRISEYTPWGSFVKAFGWDVAPGAVNEQQEIRVQGTAGTFTVKLGAEESGPLSLGAGSAEMQTALEGLAAVGTNNVTVTEVPGTLTGGTPFIYVLAFRNSLAATNVGQVEGHSVDPSLTAVSRTLTDGGASSGGLEGCTAESGCRAGAQGEGAGQLPTPFAPATGIGVDSAGNIYVREEGNNRVQKFDSAGRFLLMFGHEVDHTTGANVCTKANIEIDGDVCGAGLNDGAQTSIEPGLGLAVAVDGTVYVPENEHIQVFASDGTFQRSIAVPGANLGMLALNSASGGLLAPYHGELHFLSQAGGQESSCPIPGVAASSAVADAGGGDAYVVQEDEGSRKSRALLITPSCQRLAEVSETPEVPTPGLFFNLTGLAVNGIGDLYTATSASLIDNFIRSYGPGPVAFESPPSAAPSISGQFASKVESGSAELGAFVNPHFWTDTKIFVEYGTGLCSAGECAQQTPAPPGVLLTSAATNADVRSPSISLGGLAPNTTYHFRFVAVSSGGGPVRGIGGVVGTDGEESDFTTPPSAVSSEDSCPNRSLRFGLAARLPDCRAYEMVSPVDKEGGEIRSLLNTTGFLTAFTQSSADGNGLAYSSYRSFGGPEGAPYTSQYIARRGDGGWSTTAISSRIGPNALRGTLLEAQHKVFSPDLCSSVLLAAAEPPLAAGAPTAGFVPYVRRNCATPATFEALLHAGPTVPDESFYVEPQGLSDTGSTAMFHSRYRLTEDATAGVLQAYVSEGGSLRFLCMLPDGSPWAGNCSGGTASNVLSTPLQDRFGSVVHALSADGRLAYWTAGLLDKNEEIQFEVTRKGGSGIVYLRENPGAAQSEVVAGECTEPAKACTIPVSGPVSSKAARFLMASPSGSRALFVLTEGPKEGSLYRFEVGAGAELIASKTIGLAGASQDLSSVYFVSEGKINGQGAAGKPNLFLSDESGITFIATLSATDIAPEELPSDTTVVPVYHAAQASANGDSLTFISTARLTSYDNTDRTSSAPCGTAGGVCDSEVYVFRKGAAGPVCVSCNPSGALPKGRLKQGVANSRLRLPTAATVPIANYQLDIPNAFSADGKQLYFESYDDLLPRDVNGKADVYQWQSASSPDECRAAGAGQFVVAAHGCLSLISTGESPKDSEFLAASPDGADVFFATGQSLLPEDPGLFDIYDARRFGGFPLAPGQQEPCREEGCQPSIPAPGVVSPGSNHPGPGNPKPRCPKGTHKISKPRKAKGAHKSAKSHKAKCVKNKKRHAGQKKHHRKHHHKRKVRS